MSLKAEELRIECPKCDNTSLKGRFDPQCYLNTAKGVFYCHRCKASGPISDEVLETLDVLESSPVEELDQTVITSFQPLKSSPVEAYVNKRFPHTPLEKLEALGLSFSPSFQALAIQVKDEDGSLKGIKYRCPDELLTRVDSPKYTSQKGSKGGGYWLSGRKDKLLIVEGELDAVSAKAAGFNGTVLALQTNHINAETALKIRQYTHVFSALDRDQAGSEAELKLTQIIAPKGFQRVVWASNVKDLNELYQLEGAQGVQALLNAQAQSPLEVATFSLEKSKDEMLTFLSDIRNTKGDSTGWSCLDAPLGGGLRPNEMTVVNAFAKTGKSSFINNLTHNIAKLGKKVAIASFEMDPARSLYPSLLSLAGDLNLRKIDGRVALSDAIETINSACSYLSNIYTLKAFGYTEWEKVESWAKLMLEEHQIEYLVLDHAGFMVEKMTDAEDNQILAKNIKRLTNETGLHIIVVVQAPKTKDGLSIQTAYGGMAWAMNADNFITLERTKDKNDELQVTLEAARYPGARSPAGPFIFVYDFESGRLSE